MDFQSSDMREVCGLLGLIPVVRWLETGAISILNWTKGLLSGVTNDIPSDSS